MPVDARGVLYPARLPTFRRLPPPDAIAGLVRWFWIPRWRLAPGRTSRQEVLPFPATNLVVQGDGVVAAGPTTRIAHRDLVGTGWAVGALLRPSGAVALGIRPAGIRDREVPFDAPALAAAVTVAMTGDDEAAADTCAVLAFTEWLAAQGQGPGEARTADAMEELVGEDRSIVRVEQLAARLHLSVRSVQRLADRYFGVPPLAIIRRYRLQEAAERLRLDPRVTVAQVAADLGYADHAHLTADFRSVLGFTPRTYRIGLGEPAGPLETARPS